ncbi:MAG: DUF6768 family protein [Sedimentisphaeraceae bacterium JB056]
MNDDVKRILDDDVFSKETDVSREDTLRGMISTAYSARMRSMMVLAWIYILIFMGLAIWAAVEFCRTEQLKIMIFSSAGFVVCMLFVSVIKLWIWQNVARINLKREIKRLELKVAELITVIEKDK